MADQKKGQPHKASPEKTHLYDTSNHAQLVRLVPRLREGPADTFADCKNRLYSPLPKSGKSHSVRLRIDSGIGHGH